MSAEDLDKLFRDKLKNRPVAPSNDAWERLQYRMQQPAEELRPNPFLIPVATEQKEERGTVRMWYYSAAAAVTMLLSVGLWVNRDNIDTLQPTGTVATVQELTKPPTTTDSAPAQETTSASESTEKVLDLPLASSGEVHQAPAMASVQRKATTKEASTNTVLLEAKKGFSRQSAAQPKLDTPEPMLVATATPSKSQEVAKNTAETPGLEIIVKLDNAQATTSLSQASTKETDTPEGEDQPGTGRVLKGILKQVKNLKDGEKVKLSELGYTKHTYALETRIGNKKITKTIEL